MLLNLTWLLTLLYFGFDFYKNILNRFKQLKEEESKRKGNKALAAGDSDLSASTSEDEESDDEITEEGGPEERYNSSSNKKLPNYSGKKGKRSKRKRMVQ